MNHLLSTAASFRASAQERLVRVLPAVKQISKGALIGGVPLFLIASIALGVFSGYYGLPTPPAEIEDLQSSISEVFNRGK